MESSKQVMELFFLLPGLWSNNFFYKILPSSVPVGKSSQTELALILIITSPTHPHTHPGK